MEIRKPIVLYYFKPGTIMPVHPAVGECMEIKLYPSNALVVTKPILSLSGWGEFETVDAIYKPSEVMDHDG